MTKNVKIEFSEKNSETISFTVDISKISIQLPDEFKELVATEALSNLSFDFGFREVAGFCRVVGMNFIPKRNEAVCAVNIGNIPGDNLLVEIEDGEHLLIKAIPFLWMIAVGLQSHMVPGFKAKIEKLWVLADELKDADTFLTVKVDRSNKDDLFFTIKGEEFDIGWSEVIQVAESYNKPELLFDTANRLIFLVDAFNHTGE